VCQFQFTAPDSPQQNEVERYFSTSYGRVRAMLNEAEFKMKEKLANKGFPAIYLGPSVDHKGDTYVFWNPKTKHSLESHSAVLLQQNYGTINRLD
jgi:hypothetical protein